MANGVYQNIREFAYGGINGIFAQEVYDVSLTGTYPNVYFRFVYNFKIRVAPYVGVSTSEISFSFNGDVQKRSLYGFGGSASGTTSGALFSDRTVSIPISSTEINNQRPYMLTYFSSSFFANGTSYTTGTNSIRVEQEFPRPSQYQFSSTGANDITPFNLRLSCAFTPDSFRWWRYGIEVVKYDDNFSSSAPVLVLPTNSLASENVFVDKYDDNTKNLQPETRYKARIMLYNRNGIAVAIYSSSSISFETIADEAGLYVKVDDEWIYGKLRVKIDGKWEKVDSLYNKELGKWVEGE